VLTPATVLLVVLLLLLTGCGEQAAPIVKVSDLRDIRASRTILVTGFGPFLDVRENPSWEAIRDLDGARIGRAKIAVVQLDVSYARAADQLQAAIDRVRPDAVLSLGVAPDAALRLETTARNLDTERSPDATGEVRAGKTIRDGGPATIATRLPLDALRKALTAGGYEVRSSDDAGGYLCNHLFYELLTRRPEGTAGFVHVPEMAPPWDLARLKRAVRRMLEVLAAG
jgi:pyroglutamyl-peptidase